MEQLCFSHQASPEAYSRICNANEMERLTSSGCQMERRTEVGAVGHHTEVFQNSGFEHFDVGNFGSAFWA